MNELEWTGERLVTSVNDDFHLFEHLHRYALAQAMNNGKIVLDIASGEGYGSYLLSQNANYVYGVDIDEASVKHAQAKYASRRSNLAFKQGSTSNIPLENGSVDLVVSFETIEHHDEHEQMMAEIKRVLKPDGLLVISSPNKTNYQKVAPNNPYHVKELEFEEFEAFMKSHFKHTAFYEQRYVAGSLITPIQSAATSFEAFDGDYEHITNALEEESYYNRHYYSMAVCSNGGGALPGITSFFNGVKAVLKQNNHFYNKGWNDVQKSSSYKIGNWLVNKLAFLKGRKGK